MRHFAAVLLFAPTVVMAQFKCTGADGKISFQQMPCSAGGKQQALVLKTPLPDAASNRPSDGITTPRDVVTGKQRAVKLNDIDLGRLRQLNTSLVAAKQAAGK